MSKIVLIVAIIKALVVGLDPAEIAWCMQSWSDGKTKVQAIVYCLEHPELGDDTRLGA